MNSTNIEKIIKETGPVVCYFSHDGCNVCKVLRPQIEHFVSGRAGIEFLYINTVAHPQVAGQHMVFAVPTIVIFMDGREVKRFSRHIYMDDFSSFLEKIE